MSWESACSRELSVIDVPLVLDYQERKLETNYAMFWSVSESNPWHSYQMPLTV